MSFQYDPTTRDPSHPGSASLSDSAAMTSMPRCQGQRDERVATA